MRSRLFLILSLFGASCTPVWHHDASENASPPLYTADSLPSETELVLQEGAAFGATLSESTLQAILQAEQERLETQLEVFHLRVPKDEEAVVRWLEFYKGPGLPTLQRFYRRGLRYLPTFLRLFEEAGLPRDLAYLPLVESGFNPWARSRAGAVGIWQFMRGTARKYGLRVDWWVDERRDPIRSTKAAIAYLKDLYTAFGRWDLALAAYNVGEGKVKRILQRTGGDNFWEVRRRLPRETRNYVPAFFAVLLLIKNPDVYHISLDTLPEEPWVYDSILVPAQVELKKIAEWAGTTESVIRDLNPQFRRWATPPDLKNFYLRVPKGTAPLVAEGMQRTPRSHWVTKLLHRVRKGESLWTIARKYGVSLRAIARVNRIRNPRYLRVGQLLWIPVPGASTGRAQEPVVAQSWEPSKDGKIVIRVRKGDTLWEIARRLGVTVSQLKAWNQLTSNTLHPGQTLIAYPRKTSYLTYRVQRGDTLSEIARRYQVSVRELIRMNGIKNPRRIRPGQRLKIPISS